MKRILIALLFIFSCIGVMAQNTNEHLKFMGIPINGTLENFTQKLVAKGMKRQQCRDDMWAFRGKFAGKDDCTIYVSQVPSRNIVYKVVVCLPPRGTWEWLENDYKEFKKMLTTKYEEPYKCSESFKEGTYVGSDYLKISALKGGECNYYSIWGSTEGVIGLDIFNADGSSSCCVRLTYIDLINGKLADSSKQDDL